MKIAAMHGVYFSAPQTCVHGPQIKQFARASQQPLGLIIIQSPLLDTLLPGVSTLLIISKGLAATRFCLRNQVNDNADNAA